MDLSVTEQVIGLLDRYMLPLLLVCVRTLAMLQVFPLFFWLRLTGFMRFSVAMALVLPHFMVMHPELEAVRALPASAYLWLIMKEALLGAALGLLLGLPFWACQAAGDIVEVYRGANVANVADPVNASQTSVFGQAMLLIGLGLFVLVDGVLVLAQLHMLSYAAWPVLAPRPTFEMAQVMAFAKGTTRLFEIGLVMAAPLMIVMFFVELATAFSGRGSKLSALNDLSITFKNLVLALLIPSYMLFISDYVRTHTFAPVTDYLRVFAR
jgi:type III secretion protein T